MTFNEITDLCVSKFLVALDLLVEDELAIALICERIGDLILFVGLLCLWLSIDLRRAMHVYSWIGLPLVAL